MRMSLMVLAALGCGLPCAQAHDHTPMTFDVDGSRIIARGDIDGDTLDAFEDALGRQPDADTLVLHIVGGSVDDEANLEFARTVRDLGFTTLVPSDGLVASGGTDLFLAGTRRILEPGACVGVHSWAAETYTASELARSDPEHDRYLEYYADLGIPEAFYWFTLEAAPDDGMHWMTASEISQFEVATDPVRLMGNAATCNRR